MNFNRYIYDNMKDTNKNRVSRLAALVDTFATQKAFAESGNDVSHKYINMILKGRTSFGEKAARNLETKLGLPHLYFDQTSDVPAYELNVDQLTGIIEELENAILLTRVTLTAREKAILIAENYATKTSDS